MAVPLSLPTVTNFSGRGLYIPRISGFAQSKPEGEFTLGFSETSAS